MLLDVRFELRFQLEEDKGPIPGTIDSSDLESEEEVTQ